MTDTIQYGKLGKQDIRFGTGTFAVTLPDGHQVTLDEVDVGVILADTSLSTLPYSAIRQAMGFYNICDPAYGAVAGSTADQTTAIQAAIDAAEAAGGGVVWFPPGTYAATSADLTVDADNVVLAGCGYASQLAFAGYGLVFDGSTTHTEHVGLHGLRISRTGTAGPAIYMKGGGAGTGVVRWGIRDVHVTASTGAALKIAGSYLGEIWGCYLRGSALGFEIAADPVLGTIYGNAIKMFGGEIQNCTKAGEITGVAGLGFYGTTIEGNDTGMEFISNCRSVVLYNCYWEANGTYDIKLGTNAPTGVGFDVETNYFADSTGGKDYAILLVRGYGIEVSQCQFSGYGVSPIQVNESSTGAVRGVARYNNDSNGNPIITRTAGVYFSPVGTWDHRQDFTDGDTTPSVEEGDFFRTANTNPTSITAFDGAVSGKRITILFNDTNTTIVESASMILSGTGNFVGTANDILVLQSDGTNWFEVSRSVN